MCLFSVVAGEAVKWALSREREINEHSNQTSTVLNVVAAMLKKWSYQNYRGYR